MIAVISWLIFLALTAGAGYIVYRIVTYYRACPGATVWARLLATAKHSRTIFLQYMVILGGWGIAAIDKIAQLASMPELQNWISSNLSPQLVGTVLSLIALATIVARVRGMIGNNSAQQMSMNFDQEPTTKYNQLGQRMHDNPNDPG